MTARNAYVLPTGDYGEPLPQGRYAPTVSTAAPLATPACLPRLGTPPDTRPRLEAYPVLTMTDVLEMGQIRHICRAGFSSDNSPIGAERQVAWWRLHRERVEAWLFRDGAGNTVGYGALLQQDDGRWVSSVAVLPGFEGRGYGKQITTWTVLRVDHAVYARARMDNPPARRLHDDHIWDTITADNENEYYITRPKIRQARLAVNLDHCGVLGQ